MPRVEPAAVEQTESESAGAQQRTAPEAASPAGIVLGLQRTAGNRATQQVLSRFSDFAVQTRANEVGNWFEAKHQVRAHEIWKATGREDADANYAEAKNEVEVAWQHLTKLEKGTLPTPDEWVVMKRGLSDEEYLRALDAFEKFKGPKADKQTFLESFPEDKLFLFTDLVARAPGEGKLEDLIKGSDNEGRAEQARKELVALMAKDPAIAARMTGPLLALLVWGVAVRRGSGSLGQEGLIGIDQALNAARALGEMSLPLYIQVMIELALAGGKTRSWDQRRVESVLLLKAAAARRWAYKSKKTTATASKELAWLAAEIREDKPDDLAKRSSLRDVGGGGGLKQKFTMTCGPTSIQIVRGEADPVSALLVSKTTKTGLGYESSTAKEQAKLLGKAAAPRALDPRWKAFKGSVGAASAADAPKWQALLADIGGAAADPANLAAGRVLAKAAGYTDKELKDFKTYFVGLQTEPGLAVAEFQTAVGKADLSLFTNTKHPLKQFHPTTNPVKDVDLDMMWRRLNRGNDILIGVLWTGGGGHYMVLTDASGSPPTGGASRKFLLSDPWSGKSEWLTSADLKTGKFGTFGNGYIDDIYY